MINIEDIQKVKELLNELEINVNTWNSESEEDFEVDYEDLKKRIYDLQDYILSIVESWWR